MTELEQQLRMAAASLEAARPKPEVGIVLGSGLGQFAEELEDLRKIPTSAVPHLPDSKVSGHAGNLCFGRLEGSPVACLQGRVHLYEGYPAERVVFGVLLLGLLGCRTVLLTNAAGGIADHLEPGDLMLITDHLNLTGHSPLLGPNTEPYPRFPDLSQAYDRDVIRAAKRASEERGVALTSGVYAAMLGPSYETPAEIRMLRALGADAVGMSTVPEVIALRHRGVRVGAVSVITNRAAGLGGRVLEHDDALAVAARATERFVRLLKRWTRLVGELPAG
jgi:purine-nucleoside phosphorylase